MRSAGSCHARQPACVAAVPHQTALPAFDRPRYLLNLDGITASRRLATLLSIDSLVLKQESRWAEWYYPALQPCVHYVPIWQRDTSDILAVLAALNASAASQAAAQAIAANANAFAAATLSDAAVFAHWQRILDRYVALYRGPADPKAAAAAAAWAERVGREAGELGAATEAKCWADGGATCWYTGRDAAKAYIQAAREKRDTGGNRGGGGKGGGKSSVGSSPGTASAADDDDAALQAIAAQQDSGAGLRPARSRQRRRQLWH